MKRRLYFANIVTFIFATINCFDSCPPDSELDRTFNYSAEMQFPYVVYIVGHFNHRRMGRRIYVTCTGNIIHRNVILTAAHCFVKGSNISEYMILAGVTNILSDSEGKQIKYLSNVVKKRKNFVTSYINDIAVGKVTSDFCWTNYVQPARLATNNCSLDGTFLLAGWGCSSLRHRYGLWGVEGHVTLPRQVFTEVQIVGKDIFQYALSVFYKFRFAYAVRKEGTTFGDGFSGSALVKKISNVFVIYGILTKSDSKCNSRGLNYYADVSRLSEWINEAIDFLNAQNGVNGIVKL